MRYEELVEQVSSLKNSLAEVEKKLPAGKLPVTVLEDFKTAVDHIRLTVWALLTSAQDDPGGVTALLARFRLRRASEICRQISTDIKSGEITRTNPELVQFHAILEDTLSRINDVYKAS